MCFYAKWTPIEYDITYDLDGGINHANNPAKYTVLNGVTLREPKKTATASPDGILTAAAVLLPPTQTKPNPFIPCR